MVNCVEHEKSFITSYNLVEMWLGQRGPDIVKQGPVVQN